LSCPDTGLAILLLRTLMANGVPAPSSSIRKGRKSVLPAAAPLRHCRLDEPGHGADNDLIKSDHPERQEPSMAHLLLIDDDPDLLPDQVRKVLPTPPHRVEIAPTGSAGLELARDARPDVILLDLRLPDQSGLDVLNQLRQIDARIPVVLV